MSIDWEPFRQIVADPNNKKFLLTSHMRPDCDALGSELGLAFVLEAAGKHVQIVNGDVTPTGLAFIDPSEKAKTLGVHIEAKDLADIDVAIILDTSAWAQLGPMADWIKSTAAKVIIIDHHVGEDDINATLFKNDTAESTGRLILEVAKSLEIDLRKEMAMPLFTAMATDTGWFRFPAANALTYRAAAELIDAGASPPEIYGALHEQQTKSQVRLRGRALNRIETELDGRLVYTSVHNADFAETAAARSDTNNIINLSLEIVGTQFAIIFIEQEDGSGCKMSFRSRCNLLANEVAANFGGGGHKAAAGARLDGTLVEVQQQVLEHVRAGFAKIDA